MRFHKSAFKALSGEPREEKGGNEMEKRKGSRRLWTVLTGVFAVLLVVAIIGTMVANYFEPVINTLLMASTSKIEVDPSAANVDTEYFKSSYTYDRAGEEKLVADAEALFRQSVEEGAALLKNENGALPIASGEKAVTVFGAAGPKYITGLNTELEKAGYTVDKAIWDYYNGQQVTARTTIGVPMWDETVLGTAQGDVALITIGRRAGEGTDCAHPGPGSLNTAADATNKDYLDISPGEESMMENIKRLKDAGKFKKIVVVINTSNMVHGDFINDPRFGIDACIWMGQAQETYGTEGLVNILSGKVNPSGRLVDTVYMNNLLNPVMQNFGAIDGDMSGVTQSLYDEVKNENYKYHNNPQGDFWEDSVVYQEGIYIGYKYYETRYEDAVMGTPNTGDFRYSEYVAYPFGHGLSYTTWAYSNFKVAESGDSFVVTLDVTNTGSVAGKHSVLIYLQSPYTDYDRQNGVEKAAVQLVGFTKTGMLSAGASETVTAEVPKWMLRAYDANGAKTYILDAGDYYLTAAGSSHEAVNNILAAKGFTNTDTAGNAGLTWKYQVAALDTKIFSTSYATGNPITNLFECADPNKDPVASQTNSVTWVTRSNWTGTLPTKAYTIKYSDAMVEQARTIAYKADPAQQAATEMPHFGVANGLTLAAFMDVEYDDPMWTKLLEQMSYEETAKLVMNCWYGSDGVSSVGKLRQTDQDTSMGRTNPFTANPDLIGVDFTSGDLRAATFNREIMKGIGLLTGENNLHASTDTVKAIGLYGFSPNIHRSPYSGRNGEYFSEDAYITGTACGLAVQGMQEKGSVCFVKHFFLNDQEDERHGIATWANEQTIRECYLPAFEYTVTLGGGMGFMNSFNRLGMTWVGEHKGAQMDFLMGECGFEGNIVTDLFESDYQDVIDGLLGGTTMWLAVSSNEYSYGLLTGEQYRNDPVIVNALVEAAHRMLYGSTRCAAMNGLSSSTRVVAITPWWQTALIALDVTLGVLTAACAAMLVLSIVKNKKTTPEVK